MTTGEAPDRDVVVIGSGHNALVAACYLARAGQDVEVLEKSDVVGGAVSTVERFPGVRMDRGSSAHIMIRHTGIIEDLELAECGLHYQDLDPWVVAPVRRPDGSADAIELWRDLDAACASIARVCGERDAAAYRDFVRTWRPRNEVIFDFFQQAPTARAVVGAMGRLARISRGRVVSLTHDLLGTADRILDHYFESDDLKAALAWMAAQSGPPSHGRASADMLGWLSMLHTISPGHPIGGSGMLTVALHERLVRSGGVLQTSDGAVSVQPDGPGFAVRTATGRLITARRVLSGTHVWTTSALIRESFPKAARRLRRTPKTGNGLGMVLRVASSAPPPYAGDHSGIAHRSMVLLGGSQADLQAAYADYLAGRVPRRPAVLAMTPSVDDSALAPDGVHTTTLWAQWHPLRLAAERWDDIADREASKILDVVERHAPGFRDTVLDVHVQTPEEIVDEIGMHGANVMHLEMTLSQMFSLRPTLRDSRYQVYGVPGIYLTGASTHPGGGVFGASGRSAARTILRDAQSHDASHDAQSHDAKRR